MDLARIRDLLKLVAENDVAELELEENGVKLVVRKNAATVLMQPAPFFPAYGMGYPAMPPMQAPGVAPAPAVSPTSTPQPVPAPVAGVEEPEKETASPAATEGVLVRAPIVGTFYEAPAPDADPFVRVGDQVQPGDVLCIIEAMKLMNEIESEVAGVVRKVLVKNTEPVEYDQPLFQIDPA